MKNLSTSLILLVITAAAFSCEKDKSEPSMHSPCETVLDGWNISTYPMPWGSCYDVDFPTDEVGYTVGNQGLIFKTTTGGQDWAILSQYYSQPNGFDDGAVTTAELRAVSFLNETLGYVGGAQEVNYSPATAEEISRTDAVLLKTTDGGANWSKSYLPEAESILDLHFFDAANGMALVFYNTGYFQGEKRLMMTYDGGTTWQENELPYPDFAPHGFFFTGSGIKMNAWDENNKNILISSTDNGMTWQNADTELPSACVDMLWVDDNTGFAHCWNSLSRTTDGGNTWKAINGPMDQFHLVHFNTANDGFVIMQNSKQTNYGDAIEIELLSFYIYQTHDGGKNWQEAAISKDCDYTGVKISRSNGKFYTLGKSKFTKFEMQ